MRLEITVHLPTQPERPPFTVRGRDAWALMELERAGMSGCTPLDNPAPRWSGYVHKLHHVHGLDIETIHETHRGAFPGTHARYILRSEVEIIGIPVAIDEGRAS